MRLKKPSGAPIKARTKRLFNLRAWTPKLLLGRLSFVLILAAAAGLIIGSAATNNKQSEADSLKVLAQIKNANNCKQGLSTLESARPDPSQPKYSSELLKYKADCQADLKDYRAAVTNLNELEKYQKQQKNYSGQYDTLLQMKQVNSALRQQDSQL
jgi:hypothetical protein